MRRWVFAALVLINIGLFMWASWYRVDPGSTIPPRPLFHPELVVPLSTPGVALKSRRNEKSETPLVPAKPKMRCVSIGPFPAESAEPAAGWLAAERLEHARRSEERQVESSYWVHLGPFENRKQAEQRLKELERLGIRDLLIMPDGQGSVAISLGLFSQADNARNRLKELADKGVTAKQEIRYRTETRVWFDLRLPEPADEPVAKLRGRDWGRGVEVQDSACPAESPATPAANAPG
jgi:hypothetical protein